jgi:gamma-glutamyltranspeptidase/glutathione hydrolase
MNGSGRYGLYSISKIDVLKIKQNRTPSALTLDHVRELSKISDQALPDNSVHSVTVPGAAAAWVDTVENFGSGKLDLLSILTPAIDLAENG